MTTPQTRRRFLPAAAWSLLVAVLLLLPGDDVPDPGFWDWLDKPAHVLLFAVHFALLSKALAAWRRGGTGLAAPATISAVYALVLEVAQIRVPGRSWDPWDVVADLAGIAVVALWLRRRRARLPAAF